MAERKRLSCKGNTPWRLGPCWVSMLPDCSNPQSAIRNRRSQKSSIVNRNSSIASTRILLLAATLYIHSLDGTATSKSNASTTDPIRLSDDGGWCWFEDERVIVHNGKLIIGTVAAGRHDPSRRGDIEAIVYDLKKKSITRVELHDRLQLDDHDSPVFLVRPDNRLLTLYAKHGPESKFYYRISEQNDAERWGPVREFSPSATTRLTYSNVYRLSAEGNRVYDFFRGLDGKFKPSYAISNNASENWTTGNIFIQSQAARPYVRYASNGIDTIHFFYTEGHPRDFDNSVYHAFYRKGQLSRSDGTRIRSLSEGLQSPEEGTQIFKGDTNHVAWTADLELDERGLPYVAYSVQVGSAGKPPRQGGEDHRYRYARWDGKQWHDHPMAYAGRRLYPGEDDYTGLVALHPHNPDVAYISTDADPRLGIPLVSRSDGRRHYEIFKGITKDFGRTWTWTAVTRDSTMENLRPVIPKWNKRHTALLWLRGVYRAYTDFDLEVVALIN